MDSIKEKVRIEPTLPIGLADFAMLRELKKLYVDKTLQIYDLAQTEGYYFLSRPRRFGKSLLISTFESLFKNGLRDFKGLAIEKKWSDHTYPVIHLDLSACREFNSLDEFKQKFTSMLIRATERAKFSIPRIDGLGICDIYDAFDEMLSSLEDNVRLVLLIDEYDAPLNNCLLNVELFEHVKSELVSFYDSLKRNSYRLRFLFITGICRYKNLGIFSGMNFMTDISLHPDHGTLLGYTEDELRKYFTPYIERASEALGMDFEECLKAMAFYYDGYCFEENASTHVYTPWSILNFLQYPERGFQNYWYDSAGRPSVLLNYIKSHSLKDPSAYEKDQILSKNSLDSSQNIQKLDDLALLTQAGYLTIKNSYPGNVFVLNYPNKEVSLSMRNLYNEALFGEDISTAVRGSAYLIFATNSPKEIFAKLNYTFGRIDYQRFPIKDEAVLRGFLQMYLETGGIDDLQIEKHNAFGRSDLEFSAGERYYVLELKFAKKTSDENRMLGDAVKQIKERHYGEQCEHKKLIRMALVYSAAKRLFTGFEIVM